MNGIPNPTVIPVDNEWVSEGLGDEFKTWRSQRPVLISAQTGAGKNRFILDCLIPYAIETGQQVFLFSNRVALSVQQKRELLHKVSYPDIFTNSELEQMDSFGPVHIVNYQSALRFLHQFGYDTPLGTSPLAGPLSRGFAIFDEAHFFLSDSLFNSATSRILERLIFVFSGYVRIYMTATADDVLPILNHLEMSNQASELLTHYDLTDMDRPQRSRAMYVYEFPRDYANYNITFFTDIHQLYDRLGRATAKDKWLCFINDTAQQRQIADDLKEKYKISSVCFDRTKRRDEKVWNALLQGQLPQNVLFTTIALDNGVSIKDPSLHHIVIDCADRVSLLQMIGRKRRDAGERVNLYIRSPQPELVKRRLLDVREMVEFLNRYEESPVGFLQSYWPDFHQSFRNLFAIDSENRLVPNRLARSELLILHSFYAELLYKMQESQNTLLSSEVYPKMVLEWMNLPLDVRWVSAEQIDRAVLDLRSLLDSHIGTGIPSAEHKVFFDQFAALADTILNGRSTLTKDVRSGPSIMTQFLKDMRGQLGAVYEIKGRGTWTVTKSNGTQTTQSFSI